MIIMTYASNGAQASPRLGRRETMLPEGDEIARLRLLPAKDRPTLQDIGDRYGVSRQAVHRRLTKWMQRNPESELTQQLQRSS